MTTNKDRLFKYLWLLALSAFLIKIIIMFALGAWNAAEDFEYTDVARNLMAGKGYTYNFLNTDYKAYGFPLYPIFLWLAQSLLGVGTWQAQIVNITASSASGFIAGHLTAKLVPNKIFPVLAAATLTVFHPAISYYAIFKNHELVLVFLYTLAAVAAAAEMIETRKFKWAIVFGIILGSGYLLRSNIIIFGPGAFIGMILVWRTKIRQYLPTFLLAALVAIMVVMPWWIRCYQVTGHVVLVPTNTKVIFWRGFHAQSTGTSQTLDGKPLLDQQPDIKRKAFELDEFEKRDYFQNMAWSNIKANPAWAAKLVLKKCAYFWWMTPTQGFSYPASFLYLYMAFYSMLLAGLLIWLILPGNSPPMARYIGWTMIVVLTLIMATHSMNYVEGRHRWGIEGLIICISVAGYSRLINIIKQKIA